MVPSFIGFIGFIGFMRVQYCSDIKIHIYTEQKKKRNNRQPKIFKFNGKTFIISGLLLYDSHSWDVRVYHAKI